MLDQLKGRTNKQSTYKPPRSSNTRTGPTNDLGHSQQNTPEFATANSFASFSRPVRSPIHEEKGSQFPMGFSKPSVRTDDEPNEEQSLESKEEISPFIGFARPRVGTASEPGFQGFLRPKPTPDAEPTFEGFSRPVLRKPGTEDPDFLGFSRPNSAPEYREDEQLGFSRPRVGVYNPNSHLPDSHISLDHQTYPLDADQPTFSCPRIPETENSKPDGDEVPGFGRPRVRKLPDGETPMFSRPHKEVTSERDTFPGFGRPNIAFTNPEIDEEFSPNEDDGFTGFSRPKLSNFAHREDEGGTPTFSRPRIAETHSSNSYTGFSRPNISPISPFEDCSPIEDTPTFSRPRKPVTKSNQDPLPGFGRPTVTPTSDENKESLHEEDYAPTFSRPHLTGMNFSGFGRPKISTNIEDPFIETAPVDEASFSRPRIGAKPQKINSPTQKIDDSHSKEAEGASTYQPEDSVPNLDNLLNEMRDFKSTVRNTEKKIPGRETFKSPRTHTETSHELPPAELNSLLQDMQSFKRSAYQKRQEPTTKDDTTTTNTEEVAVEDQLESLLSSLKSKKRPNPSPKPDVGNKRQKVEGFRDGIRTPTGLYSISRS